MSSEWNYWIFCVICIHPIYGLRHVDMTCSYFIFGIESPTCGREWRGGVCYFSTNLYPLRPQRNFLRLNYNPLDGVVKFMGRILICSYSACALIWTRRHTVFTSVKVTRRSYGGGLWTLLFFPRKRVVTWQVDFDAREWLISKHIIRKCNLNVWKYRQWVWWCSLYNAKKNQCFVTQFFSKLV